MKIFTNSYTCRSKPKILMDLAAESSTTVWNPPISSPSRAMEQAKPSWERALIRPTLMRK